MISVQVGIKDLNIGAWDDFILNHPNRNIFQTSEIFEVYSKSELYEPIVLFALKDKAIHGVLLAVIQKESKGIIGEITSRSIIIGGPLVYNPDVADALLLEYNKSVRRKAIYSQFRNVYNIDDLRFSFNKAGYSYDDHLDLLIDMSKGKEILWEEIHKNRKKEIKNGLKKGLAVNLIVIQKSTVLPELYQMLKALYKKIGLPFPSLIFFQESINVLEPKGLLKTFIASIDNRIVGFRMVLTFNNLIYDWYAASDPEYLIYRPNDVLPWKVITWGLQNGYKTFDFGGAGNPNKPYGVRDYKIKFGGELVNFGRFTKIHNLTVYLLGKVGLPFYKMLRNVKL